MRLFFQHQMALAAITLLAAAGCGGGERETAQTPPPPEVAVHTIKAEPVILADTLPGRTSAYRVAEVRPQVSGLIRERLFEEGAAVKEGQPLYRIDSAPYEATFENAKAVLARAEALSAAAVNREQRYGELVKVNAVSKQDYDDAVAAAKQARADIAAARAMRDSAKVQLDRTTITAPIDGRIGRSFVTNGALATAGQSQELAVIHALDPIYVDLAQSSTEILRWKRMMKTGGLAASKNDALDVVLTLEDGQEYEQKGKLELTEVNVDPATGSVTLRAVFPNPDGYLLPGMFVRARIIEGVRNNALLVTQKAVSRNPQGDGIVFVVNEENKTEQRVVVTDRAIGDEWLLAGGLEEGERVVVEGFQRFRPGDVVTPVETARIANVSPDKPAVGESDNGIQ